MFLPTTIEELKNLGWAACDIILITGDTYIDSPFIGVAIIGKVLLNAGYRVSIIAQPDVNSPSDITRLGEPRLFWGVTGGCMDSLVANYTATGKKRKKDDLTAGGINNRRPDRAVIAYANLIRKYFKDTVPIVLGGVEASLRRIAHYDFWSNKIRRSVLFDARADVLVYGMGEKTVLELAGTIKNRQAYKNLRGLCYISTEKEDRIELPAFEQVKRDKHALIDMFHTFYRNNDPLTAKPICQKQDTRYLIQNPPASYLTQKKLDGIYNLDFQRDVHPYYGKDGPVKALETIKFSVASHRGCYGECNFCSISVHEGRTIRWRSEASILKEVRNLTHFPDFKGIIFDVGGPTANMYGFECEKKLKQGCCTDRRCLYPDICPQLPVDHSRQISLLRKLRRIKGIRQIVVASGVRYDQVLRDEKHGQTYLKEVVGHHVSGQMKIAPEHTETEVLKAMGKPGREDLLTFKERFDRLTRRAGKNQFLTYYFIAAHPGCREEHMKRLKTFTSKELRVHPQQVQIFTPTPSTYSSLTYYTEMDSITRERVFVEKNQVKKEKQKQILVSGSSRHHKKTK